LNFIKQYRKIKRSVSYEDVLAGRGIENIFMFLRQIKGFKETRYTKEVLKAKERIPLIAKYKVKDETCRETFRLYTKYYARCAKNFVLDMMAKGGLYIAGGVASKNPGIFESRRFMGEFESSNEQSEILKATPIYVVVNYNVGLLGAILAAFKRPDLALTKK